LRVEKSGARQRVGAEVIVGSGIGRMSRTDYSTAASLSRF
jgi:hypothetical protein